MHISENYRGKVIRNFYPATGNLVTLDDGQQMAQGFEVSSDYPTHYDVLSGTPGELWEEDYGVLPCGRRVFMGEVQILPVKRPDRALADCLGITI